MTSVNTNFVWKSYAFSRLHPQLGQDASLIDFDPLENWLPFWVWHGICGGLSQSWIYVCSWQASKRLHSKYPHNWNGHKEQQKGNVRRVPVVRDLGSFPGERCLTWHISDLRVINQRVINKELVSMDLILQLFDFLSLGISVLTWNSCISF